MTGLAEALPSEGVMANKDGAAIRAARKERGLSVRRLARRAGISHSHLSNIERGLNRCSEPAARALWNAIQEPLPMNGLVQVPVPTWPRDAAEYNVWAQRGGPDPAAFGGYILDQLQGLARGVEQWAERCRPKRGWAIAECAPGLHPADLVNERIREAAQLLAQMVRDAHDAWERG